MRIIQKEYFKYHTMNARIANIQTIVK